MGLTVSIYRDADPRFPDCTNGGISSRFYELTLVNVEGPFNPSTQAPAALLESHQLGILRIVPAELDPIGLWKRLPGHFMMGGNFASTSDSRFARACERLANTRIHYGAVAIHDRQE